MSDREEIAARLRAACIGRPMEMTQLRGLLHEAASEIERAHGERDSAHLCIIEGIIGHARQQLSPTARKWIDDHSGTMRDAICRMGGSGRVKATLDAVVRKAIKASAESLRAEAADRRLRKALDLLGADPHDDPHAIAEAREQLEEVRAILAAAEHEDAA